MANVLSAEEKAAVIGALAEGSSIRSIERITGVYRHTTTGSAPLLAVRAAIGQEFKANESEA